MSSVKFLMVVTSSKKHGVDVGVAVGVGFGVGVGVGGLSWSDINEEKCNWSGEERKKEAMCACGGGGNDNWGIFSCDV